jgi:amidase
MRTTAVARSASPRRAAGSSGSSRRAAATRSAKIAFTTQAITPANVDPEVVAATQEMAHRLSALGHHVEEKALTFPMQEMVSQAFIAIYMGGVMNGIDGLSFLSGRAAGPEHFEPLTWAMYEAAKSIPLSQYLLSLALLQRSARSVAEQFVEHDAWLMPVLARPPERIGFFANNADMPLEPLFKAAEYAVFTPLFNVTGAPAMSVPTTTSKAGTPIGTQLVGRFGDEATLFRLAAQLEAAHPWVDRLPLSSLKGTLKK